MNAVTTRAAVGLVAVLVFLRDSPALVVLRGGGGGPGPSPAGWGWAAAEAALVTLALTLLAALLERPLARWRPVPDQEREPPARGADVDANRSVGLLLLCSGLYLGLAPGGNHVFAGLFAVLALGVGGVLALDPREDRGGYRLDPAASGGALVVEDGGGVGGPFRAFAERLAEQLRRAGRERDRERERERAAREEAERRERGACADPWSVLGIPEGAPWAEVTAAWRTLCKRFHPDVAPMGLKLETEEALKKVNEAYGQLRERRRRSKGP